MKSSLRLSPAPRQRGGFTQSRLDHHAELVAAVSAAIAAAVGHLDDAAHLLADCEEADTALRGERTLRVDAEARWFEPAGGARVGCANRPVMRRLLLALVRAATAEPPAALTAEALVRAGWPGERIRPDAARNRLHVMLTRLRGRGLRELLVGNDLGWGFAPDVTIEIADAEP